MKTLTIYASDLLPGDNIIEGGYLDGAVINRVRPTNLFGLVWIDYTRPCVGSDAGRWSALTTFTVERG